jgi:hypothetical protein
MFFVVLILVAAWIYAKIELNDRVVKLSERMGEISSKRGGAIPSESEVKEKVGTAALELNLELSEIQVEIFEVNDENVNRADLATRMMYEQSKKAAPKPEPPKPGSDDGTLAEVHDFVSQGNQVQTTILEIRARVKGRLLLWSIDKEMTKKKAFHGDVSSPELL